MRYAKKFRLALALLIKMVALVVEVLWWNLDSGIYRKTNNNKGRNKYQEDKVQCTIMIV